MKLADNGKAVPKRDLINRLAKLEKALGTQSQRAASVERENTALLAEIIRLRKATVK